MSVLGIELSDLVLYTSDHSLEGAVWLTGMVGLGVAWLMGIMGYLIWAREPSGDNVGGCVFLGVVSSATWPLIVAAAVLWALVMGPRVVVQELRRPPRPSKDERIAALQKRTAELEAQIDRQPDGIDVALKA